MTPREILTAGSVVPVIAIDDPQTAVGLAQALLDGGIRVLEITLRTPAAIEAIHRIKREVPAAVVGAGTVINAAQLKAVTEAGAMFAISPGINTPFAQAAAAADIPVIPGVSGAGELMLALEYGFDTVKLFPAEAVGGIKMLKALHGPFPQVRFCPTRRARLSGAAECTLRRRFVAHPRATYRRKKLARHYRTGRTVRPTEARTPLIRRKP